MVTQSKHLFDSQILCAGTGMDRNYTAGNRVISSAVTAFGHNVDQQMFPKTWETQMVFGTVQPKPRASQGVRVSEDVGVGV